MGACGHGREQAGSGCGAQRPFRRGITWKSMEWPAPRTAMHTSPWPVRGMCSGGRHACLPAAPLPASCVWRAHGVTPKAHTHTYTRAARSLGRNPSCRPAAPGRAVQARPAASVPVPCTAQGELHVLDSDAGPMLYNLACRLCARALYRAGRAARAGLGCGPRAVQGAGGHGVWRGQHPQAAGRRGQGEWPRCVVAAVRALLTSRPCIAPLPSHPTPWPRHGWPRCSWRCGSIARCAG